MVFRMEIKGFKIKVVAMKALEVMATKAASQNASEACVWWAYQPKMPEAVKKLRKF